VLIGAEDPAPSSHTGPIEPRKLPQLVSENIDPVTGQRPLWPCAPVYRSPATASVRVDASPSSIE
jgi:hypothetical protein